MKRQRGSNEHILSLWRKQLIKDWTTPENCLQVHERHVTTPNPPLGFGLCWTLRGAHSCGRWNSFIMAFNPSSNMDKMDFKGNIIHPELWHYLKFKQVHLQTYILMLSLCCCCLSGAKSSRVKWVSLSLVPHIDISFIKLSLGHQNGAKKRRNQVYMPKAWNNKPSHRMANNRKIIIK